MADEHVLTVAEAAQRLRVSQETIRRWLRDGQLHGVRIGSTRVGWRIPESEVRRLLSGGAASFPDLGGSADMATLPRSSKERLTAHYCASS